MLAAIIQARMTSTRLPGKVLKEVKGKPLIWYQLQRLKKVPELQRIIIATTINKEDDPLVDFCKNEFIPYYRGSEEDVLERYYLTAIEYNVDPIVRITGDCPLLDPEIVSLIIKRYSEDDAEYVHLSPSFAEGVDCEIFSFRALELAYKKARLNSEREHVVLYMHNHPEEIKKIVIQNNTDDSKYRFTVDNPEDFIVVSSIIESLTQDGSLDFKVSDIKKHLDENPDVFKINAHIVRNEGLKNSLIKDKLLK